MYAMGERYFLTGIALLQCVGALAEALGPEWKGHAQELLIPSMLTGVSNALADSLQKVGAHIFRVKWAEIWLTLFCLVATDVLALFQDIVSGVASRGELRS